MKINFNPAFKKFAKHLFEKLSETFFRFPVTLISTALLAAVYITVSEIFHLTGVPVPYKQLLLFLVLAIPLSLGAASFFELKNVRSAAARTFIYAGVLAAGLAYVLIFMRNVDRMELMTFVIVFFSLLMFAVCIPFIRSKGMFELFVVRLISRFAQTFLYTLAISVGLIFIFLSLESMFAVKFSVNTYSYLAFIVLGFFSPVHFLSDYPKTGEELSVGDYPLLLKIIVLYIVTPLLAVFTLIMYIYLANILITRMWPSGVITYLISVYSIIGIIAYVLSAPFSGTHNWATIFTRYFFKTIIPLLLMMGFAIGERVIEFGFTEKRYLAVIFVIWLTVMVVYFNLVKSRKSARLPFFLAVILLLSVIGPWNMFNASKASQIGRLRQMMEKSGVLSYGQLVTGPDLMSVSNAEEIGNQIDYITEYYSYESINILKEPVPLVELRRALGIGTAYPVPGKDDIDHLNIFNYSLTLAFDIKNYNYYVEHDFYNNVDQIDANTLLGDFADGTTVVLNFEDKYNPKLTMQVKGIEVYSRDLFEAAGKIVDLYRRKGKVQLPGSDLILTDTTGNYEIKIVFREISCYVIKSTNNISYGVVKFVLLIKKLT